jgi:hypothetical protein
MIKILSKKIECAIILFAVYTASYSMDAPELSTRFVTITYTGNDVCLRKTVVLPGDIKMLDVEDTRMVISVLKKRCQELKGQSVADFADKGELTTLLILLEAHQKQLKP